MPCGLRDVRRFLSLTTDRNMEHKAPLDSAPNLYKHSLLCMSGEVWRQSTSVLFVFSYD
jgi:hypothetical protein